MFDKFDKFWNSCSEGVDTKNLHLIQLLEWKEWPYQMYEFDILFKQDI